MRESHSATSRSVRHRRLSGVALAIALVSLIALIAQLATERAAPPDLDAECEDGEPWIAGSVYLAQTALGGRPSPDGPSVLLFRDTPHGRTALSFGEAG